MTNNNYHIYFFKALLLSGCFFITSCENSPEDIAKITSKSIGVEEAIDVNILYSLGDKTKARLSAPYMLRHEDDVPYIEFTKTVHTDFFDDSLRIGVKLDVS